MNNAPQIPVGISGVGIGGASAGGLRWRAHPCDGRSAGPFPDHMETFRWSRDRQPRFLYGSSSCALPYKRQRFDQRRAERDSVHPAESRSPGRRIEGALPWTRRPSRCSMHCAGIVIAVGPDAASQEFDAGNPIRRSKRPFVSVALVRGIAATPLAVGWSRRGRIAVRYGRLLILPRRKVMGRDWNGDADQLLDITQELNLFTITKRDREERSEEHTSELQSRRDLVCRLLLEK